ncbi:hypothetical protein B0H63DRAFT_244930 [Podospora didyma]|uniref:Uncharacterized protein n=1 Tax=Podospora didyma TaxID=330526 RepID=A0AAE0KKG7_9PEZI|nr:hypothetical protein B0H63DRAFT_244930 [Podospora didyma]
MSSLANAKYLVDFCGRTYLRGFSTMLAVSEVIGSTVFWRLFYNEDGAYIQYEDHRAPREPQGRSLVRNLGDLNTHRHILGWYEKVQSFARARDANYKIGWSGLPDPHESFAWDKVSITAGKFLNVGGSASIEIKDNGEHISFEDDYISMVDMIADRYFLFYDLDDRRAWLFDGASTLLHLLRAFIKHSQSSPRLGDLVLFNGDEFYEAGEGLVGGVAVFKVLVNEDNQVHSIWKKTSPSCVEKTMKLGVKLEVTMKSQMMNFCVKDRVLQICRILQQITTHQDNDRSKDGVGARIKYTSRRQLEGFDFIDIATNQGTLWPKVAEIHATGAGWVDFTRTIRAVPLLGA